MDARTAGITVAILGGLAVVVGLLIMSGALSWVGRLPGDIHYSNGGTRVYIPITTMILVSVVLSVGSYILRRFL